VVKALVKESLSQQGTTKHDLGSMIVVGKQPDGKIIMSTKVAIDTSAIDYGNHFICGQADYRRSVSSNLQRVAEEGSHLRHGYSFMGSSKQIKCNHNSMRLPTTIFGLQQSCCYRTLPCSLLSYLNQKVYDLGQGPSVAASGQLEPCHPYRCQEQQLRV